MKAPMENNLSPEALRTAIIRDLETVLDDDFVREYIRPSLERYITTLPRGGAALREKLVEATDLMDKLRYMVNMGCMHGETLKRVDAFLEAVCAAPAPTPAQGGEA